MVNFEALLQDTPLPDKRLRTRATRLFQSLLQGQTANSLGMLSPTDRTQEAFTRGAYRFFDHEDVTLPALHSPMQAALEQLVCPDRRAYVEAKAWSPSSGCPGRAEWLDRIVSVVPAAGNEHMSCIQNNRARSSGAVTAWATLGDRSPLAGTDSS